MQRLHRTNRCHNTIGADMSRLSGCIHISLLYNRIKCDASSSEWIYNISIELSDNTISLRQNTKNK